MEKWKYWKSFSSIFPVNRKDWEITRKLPTIRILHEVRIRKMSRKLFLWNDEVFRSIPETDIYIEILEKNICENCMKEWHIKSCTCCTVRNSTLHVLSTSAIQKIVQSTEEQGNDKFFVFLVMHGQLTFGHFSLYLIFSWELWWNNKV